MRECSDYRARVHISYPYITQSMEISLNVVFVVVSTQPTSYVPDRTDMYHSTEFICPVDGQRFCCLGFSNPVNQPFNVASFSIFATRCKCLPFFLLFLYGAN